MKIINFGSLNIDRVYDVAHSVQPGETISSPAMHTFAGGKGLNQSVAASRAGGQVVHAGAVGADGDFLMDILEKAGVDLSVLMRVQQPSGHAIIQVEPAGQNAIIVYGGANHCLTQEYVDRVLDTAQPDDLILLQNEVSHVAEIIQSAADRGLRVVWNPSPFPENLECFPLDKVYLFIVNELEAARLAGGSPSMTAEQLLDALSEKYPHSNFVLTMGSHGVICRLEKACCSHPAYQVQAVDTTGAGDTFCGYFLTGLCQQQALADCLKSASAAAAIAVSRAGAAPSIPTRDEVEAFLRNQ